MNTPAIDAIAIIAVFFPLLISAIAASFLTFTPCSSIPYMLNVATGYGEVVETVCAYCEA